MAAKKNWKLAVRKYVNELKKEIVIDRVILFGSYARGNPKSYSDIDLAIFSKDFKDKDEIRNMQYLFQKTMAVDTSIEPHPFHPRDLRSPIKGTVVYEILKTGKRVA